MFSKIAEPIGFSASYVSKSLTGAKPLRENFVLKMVEYLGVSVAWLCGNVGGNYNEDVECWKEAEQWALKMDASSEELRQSIEDGKLLDKLDDYRELVEAFSLINEEKKEEALNLLRLVRRLNPPPAVTE